MNDNTVTPNRRHFIGGSDIAAVMGLSPYKTPVDIWLEKTGRRAPTEPEEKQARRWARGKKLEPFIVDMVIDRLREDGHTVELLERNRYYQVPDQPQFRCEIDFELMLDGEHINGDCKSVHGFARKKWGEEETDEVPIEYAAQFLWGLGITGRRRCLVAALIGLDDVAIYWVEHDSSIIQGMVARATQFWDECIVGDTMPDPITFDDIKALYPLDNGQPIEATDEVAEQAAELRRVKKEIKAYVDREKELTFAIGEFISPNALLTYNGETIATWKGQQHTSMRQKELRAAHPEIAEEFTKRQTVRVLRLKGEK